jgi:hypothetical protein
LQIKKKSVSSATSYKRRFAETHKRANFQAAVWKRVCQSTFGLPSAEKHGWVIEKNMLSVNWMDQQPASEALMLLISCGCKTNCTTKRCSCMSQDVYRAQILL